MFIRMQNYQTLYMSNKKNVPFINLGYHMGMEKELRANIEMFNKTAR